MYAFNGIMMQLFIHKTDSNNNGRDWEQFCNQMLG